MCLTHGSEKLLYLVSIESIRNSRAPVYIVKFIQLNAIYLAICRMSLERIAIKPGGRFKNVNKLS